MTEQPHVVNIRFEFPDVYVDRRGRWGNPFHITAQRTREQVIQDHKDWLNGDPQLAELVGPPPTKQEIIVCGRRCGPRCLKSLWRLAMVGPLIKAVRRVVGVVAQLRTTDISR